MSNSDTRSTSNSEKRPEYFDVHTTGIGYLRRVRTVTPDTGDAFQAVTIAALRGPKDRHRYTYFDCTVSGPQAQVIIRRLQPEIEAGKVGFVRFKLGDLYPAWFIYQSGPRQGELGITVKARLLRIEFAMVDGVALDLRDVAATGESHA